MYKILSVGGSIIIPKTGFDADFLKRFCSLIISRVKKGEKFIIVVGGGATARQYQRVGKELGLEDNVLDWLGIYATQLNALFVKHLFGRCAHPKIIFDPTKKFIAKEPIILAGGWKPGFSTDMGAVLLAKTFKAKELYNLSNIDYVYDSDPITNSKAKIFERLNWKQYRKIIGNKWTPGAHYPFDPSAAKEAEKFKMKVEFIKGTDLTEVGKAISGGAFAGTTIS